MKLLVEEFFGKTFEYIDGMNIFVIRWIVKFIFYLVFVLIGGYVLISVFRKDFLPIVVIVGLLILGEVAHYLRKSREKVMVSRVTEKNSLDEKVKNGGLLVKGKNKGLGFNKVKNKSLVKKKVVSGSGVKGVGGKKVGKKKVKSKILKKKVIKNKNLLKVNKAKNEDMLKGV
ncbi:hypothetical protein HOE04_01925 [archaeon]|jgi:hypothetical protein|nr:hypothetical protein [archaeon]